MKTTKPINAPVGPWSGADSPSLAHGDVAVHSRPEDGSHRLKPLF
jgi:hypothetical protein